MLNLIAYLKYNISSFSPDSEITSQKYLDIYSFLFASIILCGIAINILVVAAYKLGYRKKLRSSNGLSSNLMLYNVNNSLNPSAQQPQFKPKIDRRVSLTVAPLKKNDYQANLYKRHSINPTRSSFDFRRSLRQSSNSLTMMSYELAVNRIRHTLCSYFILSLGYCDLFICSLVMPISLVIESGYFHHYISDFISSEYVYADLCCQLSFYLLQIPVVLEIEILLTIAIDRYSSVFNPMKIYFFDRNKSKLTLIAQILLAFVLSLPNLFFYTSKKTSQNSPITGSANNQTIIYSFSHYCQVRHEYYVLYSYYQCVLLVLFLINFVTISMFYLKVYGHVYKRSCDQRDEKIGQKNSPISKMKVNEESQDPIEYGQLNNFMGRFCIKSKAVKDSTNKKKETSISENNTEFTIQPVLNNIEEIDYETELNEASHFILNIAPLELGGKDGSITQKGDSTAVKQLKRSNSCPNILIKNSNIQKMPISSSISFNQKLKLKMDFNQPVLVLKSRPEKRKIAIKEESPTVNSTKYNMELARSSTKSSCKPANEIKNRFRRFSEMNISFKKQSLASSRPSLSINENPLLVRRHTQKILKHSKTARTLGIATLAFAITWFPYWYYIIKHVIYNNQGHSFERLDSSLKPVSLYDFICFKIQTNSFYLNYALNPIFYSFFNRRFRQNVLILFQNIFKSLFVLCYCCQRCKKFDNIPYPAINDNE